MGDAEPHLNVVATSRTLSVGIGSLGFGVAKGSLCLTYFVVSDLDRLFAGHVLCILACVWLALDVNRFSGPQDACIATVHVSMFTCCVFQDAG